jgi:hypothetical protein
VPARPLPAPDLADAAGGGRDTLTTSPASNLGAAVVHDLPLLLVGVPCDDARQQAPGLQNEFHDRPSRRERPSQHRLGKWQRQSAKWWPGDQYANTIGRAVCSSADFFHPTPGPSPRTFVRCPPPWQTREGRPRGRLGPCKTGRIGCRQRPALPTGRFGRVRRHRPFRAGALLCATRHRLRRSVPGRSSCGPAESGSFPG